MLILRIRTFSKKKKDKSGNKEIGTGVALAGASLVGYNVAMKAADKKTKYEKENNELWRKQVKEAKRKGVTIIDDPIPGSSKKSSAAYDMVNDAVLTQGDKSSATLAHELGHRHYNKEKAGKIGKAAHKTYQLSGGGRSMVTVSPISAVAAGYVAGKSKARKEAKGEKENFVGKVAPIATPILVASPGLVSEALASKRGIKSLKALGASKEFIKESRRNLGGAFGTYAATTAANVGIGELSKGISYKREKKELKNKEKKK